MAKGRYRSGVPSVNEALLGTGWDAGKTMSRYTKAEPPNRCLPNIAANPPVVTPKSLSVAYLLPVPLCCLCLMWRGVSRAGCPTACCYCASVVRPEQAEAPDRAPCYRGSDPRLIGAGNSRPDIRCRGANLEDVYYSWRTAIQFKETGIPGCSLREVESASATRDS